MFGFGCGQKRPKLATGKASKSVYKWLIYLGNKVHLANMKLTLRNFQHLSLMPLDISRLFQTPFGTQEPNKLTHNTDCRSLFRLRLEQLKTRYLDCSITTRTDDVVCICCEYGIIYKRCMSTEFLQSLPRLKAMHSAKIRKDTKFRKERLTKELLNTKRNIHKSRNYMQCSVVSQVGARYRISN